MEFQNVYVLQSVKSFTIYYIKYVCPRIWVNMVYV
jgi:lipid A disaccharide synthetase